MKPTMLQLYMTEMHKDEVYGIYGEHKDELANRMLFLHPDAARSFLEMNAERRVRVSDMRRTPESSLKNRQEKNGVRPGWSGHNWGFSIDIDYGWVIKQHSFYDKADLDLWMAAHGWHCHNPLGEKRSYEAWHYNYFGPEAGHFLSFRDENPRTWSRPISQKIEEYYGHWWQNADVPVIQQALSNIGLYNGAVDGKHGDLLDQSIRAFQRAWLLPVDGLAGPMTKRTLMLVSSEIVSTEEVC